jgi:ATP-binding protein involved in chromosome partitioning
MSQPTNPCHTDESSRELDAIKLQTRMSRVGRKLLVMSGKGGVGKSTIAANLAIALAATGKAVGLLDIDLHGPSIPKVLGLDTQRLETNASGDIVPIELTSRLKVVSVGMLLDSADDAVIWRGPMKYGVIQQFLRDVAWGELDYLVIDSPPGTGDEPLAVAQLVGPEASAIIVTTPQDLAINDVRRSISFCRTVSLDVMGIVENMSGLPCPYCNETIDLFKTGGGKSLAVEMNVPFLGCIPLDPQIAASGDEGRPFVHITDDGLSVAVFDTIIRSLDKDDSSAHRTVQEDTNTMRIAIPTADGKLCVHFGHCNEFAIVDVDCNRKIVLTTTYLTPPPHEPGVLPAWLGEHGTDVIIAGGMGRRAMELFRNSGIEVIIGASGDVPEALATAYLTGTIEIGQNVCDH